MNHRHRLFFLIIVAALIRAPASAQQREGAGPRDPAATAPATIDSAIDRGLTFLQRQQHPDGSFNAVGPRHAVTGLALLAFLSAGHMPDTGKYGLTVRSAIAYLADLNPTDGYYGREANDPGRMYGHCIVTIALSEVYGIETDEQQRRNVRAALERALKVIYEAQDAAKNPDALGGWRYEPQARDSDLSVSSWCLIALRAGLNAGMDVPKERIDRALQYVMRCHRPGDRGFAYLPTQSASPTMTAAALLNLFLADAAERPEVAPAVDFIIERPIREGTRYYYYSLYVTTQAAHQAGERAWTPIWRNNSRLLLAQQSKDAGPLNGSWPPRPQEPGANNRPGRVYPTAMSVLTLAVPLRLLPIYQR